MKRVSDRLTLLGVCVAWRGLLACCLAALLVACGEAAPKPGPAVDASAACRLADSATVIAEHPIPPAGTPGPWFAQELWLSYHSPEHKDRGHRYPRTREEAIALARDLCQRVHRGEDLGRLARIHSNGFGGRAFGYAVLALVRAEPDARDHAFIGTPVGEITPMLDWMGGIWFAKRIDRAAGRKLQKRFEQEQGRRARARVIVFHHRDAWPKRMEFDGVTREMATSYALRVLEEVEKGVPFERLAGRFGNDGPTRERKGLLHTRHPREGEDPSWIHWGDMDYPNALLELILEKGEVGRVHPTPLDTKWGVMVVEILEREGDEPTRSGR